MLKDEKRHVKQLKVWGNLLCISIPKSLTDAVLWKKGDAVILEVIDGHIVITKVPLPRVSIFRSDGAVKDVQP